MSTSSSSLSRLVDDWPGWDRFLEGRVAPEVMHLLDADRIRVEEVHEDGAVVVRAELPGVDPDTDIEVTVTDGALEIRAHREQREEEREEGRYRTEFRYGSFLRRVPLPAGATDQDVSATYRDGILEVRVPVAEEPATPEPERIPINRA